MSNTITVTKVDSLSTLQICLEFDPPPGWGKYFTFARNRTSLLDCRFSWILNAISSGELEFVAELIPFNIYKPSLK